MQRHWLVLLAVWALLSFVRVPATPAHQQHGTLTVAVATFGSERWLPHLYVGAEDLVYKPMFDNLLTRDPQTGALAPLLAERWEILDGGKAWRFHLRKGVPFHHGRGEVTGEAVKFTFEMLAKTGSVNALAPEFRLITRMEITDPLTITLHFDKPFVTFGNRVTHGLSASVAYIHSKQYVETVGEAEAERHPIGTGPWQFVEHLQGNRIVYEAVESHWRARPHFQRLVFLRVPDMVTRIAMLRSGDADVVELGGEYVEGLS